MTPKSTANLSELISKVQQLDEQSLQKVFEFINELESDSLNCKFNKSGTANL